MKEGLNNKYQPEKRAADKLAVAIAVKYDGKNIRDFLNRADQLYSESKLTS